MFTQSALIAETGKLRKFSMRLTKNKADADDLFQSTCLRALEKAHYFEDGSNLFSWTSKIMFNIFVSNYRRKVKFETQYDPEPILQRQIVVPAQETKAELSNVTRAMMNLDQDHREILILVCVQGLSYQEVSRVLEIPIGTVRSRLSRAREQLQVAIETTFPRISNGNTPALPAYIASYALKKIRDS